MAAYTAPLSDPVELDVVIVGAGFAGLHALYQLREAGFRVRVVEAGSDIGGTWFHNRYPGARCDIESLDYSYSFSDGLQQEWHWSERYSSQGEIKAYIDHVADRFSLRRDIDLNTRVETARFDDAASSWSVRAESGATYRAHYLVLASGVLSTAQLPKIDGIHSFRGSSYHTSDSQAGEADFAGKRVGVIGTGSSATQLIPVVAAEAEHLYVFQRTANFVMPARNQVTDPADEQEWKAHYPEMRRRARQTRNGHNQSSNDHAGHDASATERAEEFERCWQQGGLYMMRAFTDILTDPVVNAEAGDFVRAKIRETVEDPRTAEALCPPKDLAIGTKRLCSGTDYYETYNRDDVTLVDLRRAPLERVTLNGIETADAHYELDVIIYATGFDAMTGSYLRMDIRGRDGVPLRERWAHGPRTYLGVMAHGFPNMFLMAGPQSPSVFSNMVNSAEQHGEWITRCVRELDRAGIRTAEPSEGAEDEWVAHVTELADRTLYAQSRNSWFWGANTPGKPQVFMPYLGGVDRYGSMLNQAAEGRYPELMLGGPGNPRERIGLIEEHDVQVGSLRTHYVTAGDPGRPAVVLLHDGAWGGDGLTTWREVLCDLASDFYVLAPDLLGFGRTDKVVFLDTSPYEFRVRHIAEFCQAVEMPRPVHFVGTSFGGSLVLRAAASRGWPMASATSIGGAGGPWRTEKGRQVLSELGPERDSLREVIGMLTNDAYGYEDNVDRRARNVAVPGHYAAMVAPSMRHPLERARLRGEDYPASLRGAGCPVHVVEMSDDQIIESGWAAKLRALAPNVQAHFLAGPHSPNLSAPSAVAALIREIVASVGGSAHER